jgi:ribosomal protein L37E
MSDERDERPSKSTSLASIFANATAPTPGGTRITGPLGPGVDTRTCRRCGSPRVDDPRATTCSFCGTPYFAPEDP